MNPLFEKYQQLLIKLIAITAQLATCVGTTYFAQIGLVLGNRFGISDLFYFTMYFGSYVLILVALNYALYLISKVFGRRWCVGGSVLVLPLLICSVVLISSAKGFFSFDFSDKTGMFFTFCYFCALFVVVMSYVKLVRKPKSQATPIQIHSKQDMKWKEPKKEPRQSS